MKNAVIWDIRTQFVPHKKHVTSQLQNPAGYYYLRFEAFTAVTTKNPVFWHVTLCGSCTIGRFGGTCRLASIMWMLPLLVTANVRSWLADSCHADDGGDTFLHNVTSYKSHMV
jgi:hypothetical protein